ncbi:MAG: methyltransferase domain-containing protein [Candidatus Taylorbacteria bacterium]|nr:methyltransferase domain-containing protein [Candidatus Taylorbacteria bacterium]
MFSDPQKNIEQFSLAPGSHVADLGSGAGFYTMAAARAVGKLGRVYAIDALKEMLQKIKNEAQRSGLPNIEALWGDIEKLGGTRLADASVDSALVCNTLFQLERKNDFPLEVKRILKPGGRVLVVDWKESFGGLGPQPEHVFSEEDARSLFEKAGFDFERGIKAGEHHYGLIFRR